MTKLLKRRVAAHHVYLVLASAVASIWWGGNAINSKLSVLPVKTLGQVTRAQENSSDPASLYPIWAKAAAAKRAEAEAAQGAVDDVFKKPEEPKPVVTAPMVHEPDFPSLVHQKAALSSVTDNGAVFNGSFYLIGQEVELLAVQKSAGGLVTPTLKAVSRTAAVLRVAGKDVVVQLGQGGDRG